MAGITRQGLDAAGGALTSGSGNVFANNAPVVRIGDSVATHGKAPHVAPVMVGGNGTVLTNNIPTCRAGHPASCGHTSSGSGDVEVG